MVGCQVTWGELLWLVATWHAMSFHVVVMSFDVIACVVSSHVLQGDVM